VDADWIIWNRSSRLFPSKAGKAELSQSAKDAVPGSAITAEAC
jgi:hypothetical protein